MSKQFHAGQRVRIKDNCDDNIYDTTDYMRRYLGKETTIASAYRIDGCWCLHLTIGPDFAWDEYCVDIIEDSVALPSSVIDLL